MKCVTKECNKKATNEGWCRPHFNQHKHYMNLVKWGDMEPDSGRQLEELINNSIQVLRIHAPGYLSISE